MSYTNIIKNKMVKMCPLKKPKFTLLLKRVKVHTLQSPLTYPCFFTRAGVEASSGFLPLG